MKRVFVDTAAWYAFVRADDPDHDVVKSAMERWETRLVTSNFVFDEVITLVRARLGHSTALAVGKALLEPGVAELVRIAVEDEEEAWKLFSRHSDKHYSFTDCTSFALMQRLGLETAITTDRHFRQAGFDTEP
ncbi:MAG: type II toxin-antitoxin system VapC family toxin [Acidobacteriota bacterium]